MSVRQHLLATLVFCLAITLGMTFALHLQQRHEAEALKENFTRERQEQLDDVVEEQSSGLAVFAQDYSGWDDMVNFAASPDPEWARLNIAEVMERYRLSAVWLVSPEGKLLYSHFVGGAGGLSPPSSLPQIVASKNWSEEIGGFYRSGDLVVDMHARPVQPTADTKRETKPVAWLLAGRVLDADVIERMERKLQAKVSLHDPAREEPMAPEHSIIVHHPLTGLFEAAPVAEWHAAFQTESLELGEHYNDREMIVWIAAVVLLLGVVGWSLTRNVLRPLARISASLQADSPEPLSGVSPNLPEFSRIAGLIRESFKQREALRHEIDERVRLGRDLHDGVIQNLYATGMGIAHGVRMVSTDPEKARERLEETLRTLNETMETLRGFIARAEPEASADVDFTDACITLFQTLRVHRECELDLDIGSDADATIPADQKANLLFIVREAISNALRHGEARHIAVSLRRSGAGWTLRVRDDGRGHDFSSSAKDGRGLDNIRARARNLGGSPRFEASPAGGVDVVVEWSSAKAGS